MALLPVLPESPKRLLEQKSDSPENREKVQSISNFSPYATPIVDKANLTLRNTPNPICDHPRLAISKFRGRVVGRMSPNMEKPGGEYLGNVGGLINNTRRKSQTTHHIKRPRISAGEPLHKGSLTSYKRKDMAKFRKPSLIMGNSEKRPTCISKNREREGGRESARVSGH